MIIFVYFLVYSLCTNKAIMSLEKVTASHLPTFYGLFDTEIKQNVLTGSHRSPQKCLILTKILDTEVKMLDT